mgnify:CR=1 FL=1
MLITTKQDNMKSKGPEMFNFASLMKQQLPPQQIPQIPGVATPSVGQETSGSGAMTATDPLNAASASPQGAIATLGGMFSNRQKKQSGTQRGNMTPQRQGASGIQGEALETQIGSFGQGMMMKSPIKYNDPIADPESDTNLDKEDDTIRSKRKYETGQKGNIDLMDSSDSTGDLTPEGMQSAFDSFDKSFKNSSKGSLRNEEGKVQLFGKKKDKQSKEKNGPKIKSAFDNLNKGALHRELGVPEDENIPKSMLKNKPGDSEKTRKRKQFAKNFGK